MIFDARLEFADAAAVTYAPTTANLPNQIDTGSIVRDIGNGDPMYVVVMVDTAITVATTAGTIRYRIVSDDTAAISTTTCTVHATSPSYATSSTATAANRTTAGSVAWVFKLSQGIAYERFLGVQVMVGTNTIAAGKVNSFITKDSMGWTATPDAL